MKCLIKSASLTQVYVGNSLVHVIRVELDFLLFQKLSCWGCGLERLHFKTLVGSGDLPEAELLVLQVVFGNGTMDPRCLLK